MKNESTGTWVQRIRIDMEMVTPEEIAHGISKWILSLLPTFVKFQTCRIMVYMKLSPVERPRLIRFERQSVSRALSDNNGLPSFLCPRLGGSSG